MALTIGTNMGPEMERFEEARLILLWGTNPITSSVHLWSRVTEARRRGARVIAIDPTSRCRRRSAASGCRSGPAPTRRWRWR